MSSPYVEIHDQNVLRRLEFNKAEESNIGFLLGNYRTFGESAIIIHSCSSTHGSTKDLSLLFQETTQVFSGDSSVVGIWFKTTGNVDVNVIERFCLENVSSEFKLLCSDFFVVYAILENDSAGICKENIFLYNTAKSVVTSANVLIERSPIDLLTFRLAADLAVEFTITKNTDLISAAISQIEELKQHIQSDKVTTFLINNSNILLSNHRPVCLNEPMKDNALAREILEYIEDEKDDSFSVMKGKRNKRKISTEQVVDVSLLTGFPTLSRDKPSPVAYYKSGLSQYVHFYLPVNSVVQTDNKIQADKLPNLFITAVCKQLTAMATSIQKYSTDEICIGRPFHFQPWECDRFVTIIYPEGKIDEDLESERRTLHEMLLLPLDRPLLRKCNAYRFPADRKRDVYLTNTHVGLKNDGSDGSKVSLVQGTYSYHHYMQDKFNDDKWGCAYRSLQTLVSWFRHQGYTDVPVPSHRVIQQTLVDVGDKDAKFVGSKQWIGSIEVCTVLNQLLEVTSKIMCVNAGSEMSNKGRELAHHFETQGTPIMIGGGVLAHTILGVDFNERSGEMRFLILDPHYTGSEDIKVIQDKGWCGWKTADFWDPNVFYNLCLPQRPKLI